MDSTQQRILSRRAEAEQRLQDALQELAVAQGKVDKCNFEIGLLNDLLGDDAPPPRSPAILRVPLPTSNGNGHQRQGEAAGETAPVMVRELKKAGGKLTLVELADRMVAAGFAPVDQRQRVMNNVSSVFYRAIKNPDHPFFRRAGRGEIQLASA